MTRIEIDPNVRLRHDLTMSGFEDVQGEIKAGEWVDVYESESGLEGRGLVSWVDEGRRLVYLAVDWSSLRVKQGLGIRHHDTGMWRNFGYDYAPAKNQEVVVPDNDPVNHPSHYTNHPSGLECIQVTEHLNFCLGNAVKYIWRADEKGARIQDLEKARWYLDREIARRKKLDDQTYPLHEVKAEEVSNGD